MSRLSSRKWRVVFAATGVALLAVVGIGIYSAHLIRQRRIQELFRYTPGVSLDWDVTSEHWLMEYVGKDLEQHLPFSKLHCRFDKEAPAERFADAQKLTDVHALTIEDANGELAWDLVKSHPRLSKLALNRTEITDDQIAKLSKFPELTSLRIVEASVTDKGMASLAELTSLNVLVLQETHVSKAAFEAFIAAHPEIEHFAWSPARSTQQIQIAKDLTGRDFDLWTSRNYGIEPELIWHVHYDGTDATLEDAQRIASLGHIAYFGFGEPVDIEFARALAKQTQPKEISFSHPNVDVEQLRLWAEVPSVQKIEFGVKGLSPETLRELESRYPNKLVRSTIAFLWERD